MLDLFPLLGNYCLCYFSMIHQKHFLGFIEDILIDDLQGIEGGIISIEGYLNESITIDGTIEINNSDWQPLDNVSGAYYIYQAKNITQLFVDEQQMVNKMAKCI